MKKSITKNFKQTQRIGENLAKEILASGIKNSAVVLALRGDLGAGKTTFLQGFAKGLGIKENVLSPTFIVMKRFSLKGNSFKNFYHFDLYRLNSVEPASAIGRTKSASGETGSVKGSGAAKEILHLGFAEIILSPENIVAIEWPEKIKKMLPKNVILIKFRHLEENKRELTID